MIRIAHTSDLHIDERHRLEDTVAVLQAFIEQAREEDVDLIAIAGDLFERRSTPAERNVLAAFLQQASEVAPLVVVKGNHDAAEDLNIFSRLEAESFIRVYDRPTLAPDSAEIWHLVGGKKVGILALPWFDKAHLVAGLDATVDAEQTRQRTIAAARDMLTCVRAEALRLRAAGAVPILIGHIQVAGSEVATGQTLIGTSVELAPSELLDVGAACALLGHIHMSQEWFEGRVAYSGSPKRCNFGESEAKGWRLVTISDAGEFVSSELKELPVRPMVFLEINDVRALASRSLRAMCLRGAFKDAIVRLRYFVRAEDLHLVDEAEVRGALEDAGAHEVKLEAIVESEVRVRSQEIIAQQTTAGKVEAFWRAKGIEVDAPTRERVRSKLGELEAAR